MMAEAIAALFKGSRAWTDCAPIEEEIECLPSGSIVLVGDCPTGTDRIVREFVVRSDKLRIADLLVFPANWDRYGKSAGPRRNAEMVRQLTVYHANGWQVRAYAYPLGDSRGTQDCVKELQRAGIPTKILAYTLSGRPSNG